MATPLSSSTSYCTPAQLLSYYDRRQIGDWLLDTDERQEDAENSPIVQEQLDAAAGMIESACVVGEKYMPEDLAGLTGVSSKTLRMMNAHLAGMILRCRRQPDAEPPLMAKWALEHCERLRLGERIFGLQENAEAGLPKTEYVTQQEIDDIRLSSTVARRFFGSRSKELRLGP